MAECPLVIIRWLDSRQPCGQWRYLSTLPDVQPVEVASVGWLVKDTADVKVVCQNVGDLEHPEKAQASGIMTIPTRCVLSIERLTEDESRPNASADFATVGSTDFVGSERFAAISDDLKIVSEQMRRAL
ncbi:hypothetical protein [Hyphomicrobium facile]|uniref:Uncharacterized protein n=1 Tax=Hyphomicrobium facile TaxID=51670 RepID=A0A1I7NTA1_9HYPH|nr:hypothetical protein [Hyphomicrobium facile]SFV37863.1 hypothetical protein SAMN04488557_3376 [Hyphomicrobium facile]